MADDKVKPGNEAKGGAGGKRPYATIDLKATEIRAKPIGEKPGVKPGTDAVPGPAPASSYSDDTPEPEGAARPAASAEANSQTTKGEEARPAARRGGGFFSHMAAGIIGGVLALSAAEWALPELGIVGPTSRLADDTATNSARLAKLEKLMTDGGASVDAGPDAKALTTIESRLEALEKTAATIPALHESQTRLVAETKATLAGAASDAGAPQLITRLAKVEGQLRALADAGANDPNAGRLEQIAALTGKVSDLETALSTQLTELRRSVTQDVEARIVSATEASEAAKAGTQRIDRDVAGMKSEAARLTERIEAVKADSDRVGEALKQTGAQTEALKSSLADFGTTAARRADIAVAVTPVANRLTALEQTVQNVQGAEAERRADVHRVVLGLQVQNLKRAIERGGAFGAELDDVKAAAAATEKVDLGALEKVTDVGVPTTEALISEFRHVANSAIDADTVPQEGGVVDRLWAGAKSIVRVRRIDPAPGDTSTEAIVGRMEGALKDGQLTEVLTQAGSLSPKAQDAVRPFLDKVAARVNVEKVVAELEEKLRSSVARSGEAPPQPAH